MIEHRTGDIFEQPDINMIAHQANLHHTFGAGIAAIILQKYPEAYDADCQTPEGDDSKLGSFSHARTKDGKTIVNVYSQIGVGGGIRNTLYDAVATAFEKIERRLRAKNQFVLGIPYGYGCGLANGNWGVVLAIFKSIFDKSPVRVVICRLPNQPDLE